jgi:hypothetical protein
MMPTVLVATWSDGLLAVMGKMWGRTTHAFCASLRTARGSPRLIGQEIYICPRILAARGRASAVVFLSRVASLSIEIEFNEDERWPQIENL